MGFRGHLRQARDVCPGPGKTLDQTRPERIAGQDDDRDFARRLLRSQGAGREQSHDDVDLEPDQFYREFGQPAELPFRRPELDNVMLSFDATEFAQTFAKFLSERGYVGIADDEHAYPFHR